MRPNQGRREVMGNRFDGMRCIGLGVWWEGVVWDVWRVRGAKEGMIEGPRSCHNF